MTALAISGSLILSHHRMSHCRRPNFLSRPSVHLCRFSTDCPTHAKMTRPPTEAASAPLTFPLRPVQSADATSTRKPARTSPPGRKGRRARSGLQCLVGNCVGEDVFISLVEVEVGIGLLVHCHSYGVGAGTIVGFFKRTTPRSKSGHCQIQFRPLGVKPGQHRPGAKRTYCELRTNSVHSPLTGAGFRCRSSESRS
jgi:hypothetical protein